MIKKLHPLRLAAYAAVAASLYLLPASPALAQPLTLNGDGPQTTFDNQGVLNYQPAPIYVGYGSGADAENTVVTQIGTGFLTGGPGYVAHSNGTGQHNTVVWNLDGDSFVQVGFDVNGLANVLGYDGSVTINIDGHSAPNGGVLNPDGLSPAWGNLRTERVTLAAREGSSATVNLTGPHANWYAWTRHIDMGPMGRAEVNIREGAGLHEAQRIAVGGSRWGLTSTDATTGDLIFPDGFGGEGYLTLDGPGSLIQFADNNNGWLRVGRHAKGEMIVSNGAVVDGATDTAAIEIWVGEQPNGDGKLTIETGGIVNMSGILRINSNGSETSYVRVDGPGSQLNIDARSGATSYVGNTDVNPGAKGVLDIVNGGSVSFRSNDVNSRLRIGNHAEAIGEVNVSGEGSVLDVGDYVQTGYRGTGTLSLTDGARLIVGEDANGASSIGRMEDSSGTLIVDGAGTQATFGNNLWVAAGSNDFYDESTGTGVLDVRNGGIVEVAGLLYVRGSDYQIVTEVEDADPIITDHRGQGSILLDNGTIRMTGTDAVSVVGPYASLTGSGTIEGDLLVANDGVISGTGAGITVTGSVGGTGVMENLTVGGVRATSDMGPLALNNVKFAEEAIVNVAITDFSDANGLLTYDSNTSLAGTHLDVSIEIWIQDPDWSAQILAPGVDHGFASVTVQEGFKYEDGLVSVDGDLPPPPPPVLVSIYTAEHETSFNWTNVTNWDTDHFPDGALHLAQFSEPVDTDRVNMLASSSLLSVPNVHQTAGILVKDGFVATPVADANFLFRNNSIPTPGFLRLHGFETEINGQSTTGLVVNLSDQNISFSTVNASYHIELARTGHFHVEKPGVQTRVITAITEIEGASHGITKTGEGILHFGAEAQNSDFSGPFILEGGIVQWTNSGTAGGANPFGTDSLILRGGTLRSTTDSGRFINTSVVFDGEVTLGSLEDGFTGQITTNSAGGSLGTTIASDSVVNILSFVNWHQGTTGEGTLTKTGPEQLIFTGTGGPLDHEGPTTVAEGMLRLNTTVNNSDITVLSGASLGFGESGTVGQGAIDTDLTLNPGSNLVFRLEGTDAYDSLNANGTLNLNGGELVIELGYQPSVGDTFTLVQNWAWEAPNGTLSYGGVPLADGAPFHVESGDFSQRFEIFYGESEGHDITIQAVEEGAPPADSYADWASGHGLAGADAAPDANPAGDGFTNLQKFAFGLNPNVPAASLADVSRDGDLLVLRWNQRTGAGIDYTVESSATLASESWTEVPDATPAVMDTPDVTPPAGYERVEWTVDVSGEGERSFYRASASVDSALLQ